MFIVFLKFSDNRNQASEFMDGHKAWLQRGFADGVFLLSGSLQPKQGGAIIAHNTTQAEIENRLNEDPFVVENVVSAEILQVSPALSDERLSFLVTEN